jgi:hypothetical protein
MDDSLLKFKEVVDEEIEAYEALGKLYQIKQAILVQGKSDALWDIDAQIVSQAENIKTLNKKRKEVAKYLGNENLTISEVIEKAKNANDAIADTIETQKTKLNILAKSLSLQEKTNMTLVKHGLIMVGKTLDIIVGVIMPHVAGQYDKKGHNVENNKSLVSSIVEEA